MEQSGVFNGQAKTSAQNWKQETQNTLENPPQNQLGSCDADLSATA
jgi:hypothetical protein